MSLLVDSYLLRHEILPQYRVVLSKSKDVAFSPLEAWSLESAEDLVFYVVPFLTLRVRV